MHWVSKAVLLSDWLSKLGHCILNMQQLLGNLIRLKDGVRLLSDG